MKKWPKDNKTVNVEILLSPLSSILRNSNDQKKDITLNFNYTGYRSFGDTIPLDQRFTEEFLSTEMEDQGRDLIDNVLVAVFQLGMEQGMRINADSFKSVLLTLRASREILEKSEVILENLLKTRD